MKQTTAYNILLVGAMIWCSMLFIPPIAGIIDMPQIRSFSYQAFSPVCHQYDLHSLHIAGYKLAVCSRCSAIYIGFLVGVIFFPMMSAPRRGSIKFWILIAMLPMLIDVFLNNTGVSQSTLVTRITTGSFFGISIALILTPLFITGFPEFFTLLQTNMRKYHATKT